MKLRILLFFSVLIIISCTNHSKKTAEASSFDVHSPSTTDETNLRILNAISKKDGSTIESLRDKVNETNKLEIAKYWNKELHWEIKDGFCHIFMDQKIEGIRHILEDGTSSPNVDSRIASLCVLLEDQCNFESFYTPDGGMNVSNFNKALTLYESLKNNK